MKSFALNIVIGFLLGSLGMVAAEDHPEWSELNNLFGKEISSAEVQEVVKKYELRKADKGGDGSFSSKPRAYSLMFRRDRISTIILQVSGYPEVYGDEGLSKFKGALPAGIKRDDLREDIIEKFGKSHTKNGDSWIVGELDIWIFFDQKTGRIDELYVSKSILPNNKK